MNLRNFLGILFCCAGLLVAGQPADANTVDGVTFTVTNPDLSGSPGDLLTWNYKVTNNNSDGFEVFAFDVNASAGFAGGTPDQSVFDLFGPTNIIANGASFSGTLFSFLSDSSVPNSSNTGFFDLTVLLLDSQGNFVNVIDLTDNYSATITTSAAVPEPSALLLLASGLLAGLFLIRRTAQ